MIFDHGNHAIHDRALDSDAFEECPRHRAAVGLVPPRGPAHLAFALAKHGGRGFGEIVAKRREDQNGAIIAFQLFARGDPRGRVHNKHRVRSDVALRVPARILRNTCKASDLGKMNIPAEAERYSAIRPGRELFTAHFMNSSATRSVAMVP